MKRVFILILFAIGVFAAFPAAAAPTSLIVTDVSLTGCSGPLIEGQLRVLAYDSSGTLLNDVDPLPTTVHAVHSNGPAAPVSWDFLASDSYQFAFSVGSAPAVNVSITIVADENGASSSTVTVGCDGSVVYSGVSGPDNRINLYHCDLTSALYSSFRGIEVWDIEADSSGEYMGAYTDEDVAEFADAPPSVNTFVKSIGKTSLEILTTGELQIKIAPDEEGKSCAVIIDGIPATDVYFRD